MCWSRVRDSGLGLPADAPQRISEPLPHDQADRLGDGTVDLPIDHQSSRRTIEGERECAPGRHLSSHRARRRGRHIVIGAPETGRRVLAADRGASACQKAHVEMVIGAGIPKSEVRGVLA
jgi:hypothetical protein